MGKIPQEAVDKIRKKTIERYKNKEYKEKHQKACKNYYKTNQHHTTGKPKSLSQTIKMSKARKDWYKNNPKKAKLKNEKSRITNIKRGTHKNERNPNWHDGISRIRIKRTLTKEQKENILKRDGYRCQQCFRHQDELKCSLIAHHIDFNKINDNPNNLITLCHNCHSQLSYDREGWIDYFQNKMIDGGKNG